MAEKEVVDMSLKGKCRWRWNEKAICNSSSSPSISSPSLQSPSPSPSPSSVATAPPPPPPSSSSPSPSPSSSSSFIFFLLFCALLGSIALAFSWFTLSPFASSRPPRCCLDDNEGAWSIGVFFGADPFSLRPIELGNFHNNETSAWPVANPILTCASASRPSHPSNFVSDPFLYVEDQKLYVFFETKNAITMQGDIGVAESTDGGISWRNLGIALDEEWHLSYPFVFAYDGQIYMMPEGSKRGDLRLYRALRFPLQWTLERVIIDKPLVDASLVEYDGKFWLFASNFQHFGAHRNSELEIYFAESPLGPWQAHKRNPVYKDGTRSGARNGGRPFSYRGKLYRVVQDCSETYGKKIRIFHVEHLSAEEFEESEVAFPTAERRKKGKKNSWNGARFHHLDAQELRPGEWIAMMDGDRVRSGDVFRRYLAGSIAFSVLLMVVLSLGNRFGGIAPLNRLYSSLSRRIAPASGFLRKVLSRFHHALIKAASSSIIRPRKSSCIAIWYFACLAVCMVCVFVEIRCFKSGAEEPYPVNGQYSQFTLLTMTHDARLWNLKLFVKHYSRCASVREIVVVWNKGIPPDASSDFDSAVPVRIRIEEHNSLNNRFKPDSRIKTKAVLELDDDIMMVCDDVERGFKAWREHPERIVGFYPRLIDGSPLKYRNKKYARNRKEYNMILTGAAFMDSEAAFSKYWGPEAEPGRALVDELFNCEDILINFVLANSSRSRSVEYIHPAWVIDMSKLSSSAISRDTGTHYQKRTRCLLQFSQLFGGLPLRRWEFGIRHDGWDS